MINPQTYSRSKISWPPQQIPPTKSWQMWRKFLGNFTKSSMKYDLNIQLGKWHSTFTQHRQWNFQYNSNTITAIHENHCDVWQFHHQQLRQHTFHYASRSPISTVNDNFLPVFPIIHDDKLIITSQRRTPINHISHSVLPFQPAPTSVLSPYYRTISPQSFPKVLSSSKIQIYVAGIASLNKASTGWLIVDNNKILYQGKCRLAHSTHNTPVRSTSLGVIAALTHYQDIYLEHHCPSKTKPIEIFVNNMVVTKHITQFPSIIDTPSKQFSQDTIIQSTL